uniref:Muscle M-line assembly protein unc-89-like n=1 Tax=Kryptolebias marmoratus TaxID=37003 RepID=A0A3Q3GLN0_KRYMA
MFLRFFFFLCAFASCQGAGETTKYVVLGNEVTFKTGITTIPDEILWKHEGNKVVEFNGKEESQYGSFEGRVDLNWHTGDLTISGIRFEDSGLYELETFSNKKLQRFKYNLEVLDKVAKPTISCERIKGNGSDELGHQATLTCSAESRQSLVLEFKWSPKEQVGPKLIIPLGEEHDDQVYSCTVSNPLTKESATFNAKECYVDETSDNIPLIVVGLCVSFLFLILLLVGLYLCCKVHRTREKTRDIEQAPPESREGMEGGDEEREVLLSRMPTVPSKQPLNKISKQNDQVTNELKQRLSTGNKNQDLSTSVSSPAPEKPPRSPDRSSDDAERADEDEWTEAPEDLSELQDSEKTNGSLLNKQGVEVDGTTSPAPEKPPRCHDLPPEKNKIKSPPPAVPEKTPLVKTFSAGLNENQLSEEMQKKESDPEKTEESDNQSSEKKGKVTKPEIDVSESTGPYGFPPPRKGSSRERPNEPSRDEDKEDNSSDQVAKEPVEKNSKKSNLSGLEEKSKKSPTNSPKPTDSESAHEQQPPVPETNQGEETTQENDKQAPENSQKPDGVDDKELGPQVNNSKDPQSSTISNPDNSDTVASGEESDSAKTDQEDQKKTGPSSHPETSLEKGDEDETTEGKNEDQS